jgi:hypothetical protein
MKETYKDDRRCYDVPVDNLEHSYGSMTRHSGEEADRFASVLPLV